MNRGNMAVHTDQPSEYCSKILSEKRKAKKPLMEKMRRARINDSLNELKSLVLESLNKDAARYSKMEKADILDMSVQYLREIKKQEKSHNDAAISEYRAGFNYCAQEVTKNFSVLENPGTDKLREGLLSHLALCFQGNVAKSPSPVCVPGAPRVQGFPAENRSMASIAPNMWVYPSPPPSPLYLSPPVSPTLPPGISIDDKVLPINNFQEYRKNDDFKVSESKTKSSGSNSHQLWRPWN